MHVLKLLLLLLVSITTASTQTGATSGPASDLVTNATATAVAAQYNGAGMANILDTTVPLDDSPEKVLCLVSGMHSACVKEIRDGVDYLTKKANIVELGPGPGNCSQVSCSYGAGIFACNDNPNSITLDTRTIANFTTVILDNSSCLFYSKLCDNGMVQGQAFSSYGWNTIAGQGKC